MDIVHAALKRFIIDYKYMYNQDDSLIAVCEWHTLDIRCLLVAIYYLPYELYIHNATYYYDTKLIMQIYPLSE